MDNYLVDADFLARFFDKDTRTIQLWAKLNGMPKEDRGQYDFVKCVKWRIERLEKEIDDLKKGDVTLYKLQQEYQKLRNEEKALDLEVKKKNLLDRETVEMVNTAFLRLIIRNIKALAPRLNKKINGDNKTLDIINYEIDVMLNAISETQLSYFEDDMIATDVEKNEEEQTQ